MSEPKWKADKFRKQAQAHWESVPEYAVADTSDRKVDEHPHSGVAIYE